MIDLITDKYDGITIDNTTLPKNIQEFENELNTIIENVKDKKLLWIKVPIEKSELIPILTKYDFTFHHCNETDITLIKRLIPKPIIPTAKNHTLGVGAVVIEDGKLLVIKDRIWKKYKLPGGHIDDRENISQALIREVFEETGIKVEFESIVSLGHFSPSQFGESNLYVVCRAKALSKEINIIDSDEILEARWIDLDTYLSCDDVHIYNKTMVQSAMKKEGLLLSDTNFFPKPNSSSEYFLI